MVDTGPNPITAFAAERESTIHSYPAAADFRQVSTQWLEQAFRRRYMYNFYWLSWPIIQLPGDMVAVQELIWTVKPDLVVETGIAHGGSLVLSASILAMIDYAEAAAAGVAFNPRDSKRRVLGIDIDIRNHNRAAIQSHPMSHLIEMIEGSSLDSSVVKKVHDRASSFKRVMVCLDSNHTHEHVANELEHYAPLTSKGSYCLVFDTVVEDLPGDMFPDRPWAPGNSPKTAVWEYLKRLNDEGRKAADGDCLMLEVDHGFEDKLLLSAAPGGYLKRM